jgi:hypothetical protein
MADSHNLKHNVLDEDWMQKHAFVPGGITCCFTVLGGETPQILASSDLDSNDIFSYLNIGLC